jgi:hypothetical protein
MVVVLAEPLPRPSLWTGLLRAEGSSQPCPTVRNGIIIKSGRASPAMSAMSAISCPLAWRSMGSRR